MPMMIIVIKLHIIWASTHENLFLVFLTRSDTNRADQPQKSARVPSTRFIQKVAGLLPLLEYLMSDTNRNYMLRKMNEYLPCKLMKNDKY